MYSDFGEAIWCAFPSSDFGHLPFNHPDPLTPGIWTTDRAGVPGYNGGRPQLGDQAGNYTNSFGGTSSACPGAAGVAALILSINPELRWQGVRKILRQACDKIDPQGGEYDANGRSRFYGYGRLNAERAARLAQPAPTNRVSIVRTFNRSLPDLQRVIVSVEVGESEPISDLSVLVEVLHTFIGDLRITLVAPSGEEVVLHNRLGGAAHNLKRTFDSLTTPALGGFKGKSAQGAWMLKIEDQATRDVGKLMRYGLELSFSSPVRSIQTAPKRKAGTTSRPLKGAKQ